MSSLPAPFQPFEIESGGITAGIDEAGRGCLAGPVTVGLVIFPEPFFKTPIPDTLRDINDSKKLTPEKRERLFEPIRSHALYACALHISSKIIDRIGINPATESAVLHLIERASESNASPQTILLDGNYRFRRVARRFPETTIRSIIKGDSICFSIAAASIIAKVARDRRMEKRYAKYWPEYQFERHKGYGTELHRDIIKELGPSPIHRRSYTLTEAENGQGDLFG